MAEHKVMILADLLHRVNGVSVTARELALHWGESDWQLCVYGTGRGPPEYHDYGGEATLQMDTGPLHVPLGVYEGIDFSLPVLKTWWAMHTYKQTIMHALSIGPLGMGGFWFALRNNIPFITTHFTRMDQYADLYIGSSARWVVEKIMRGMFTYSSLVIAHSPDSAEEAQQMGAKEVCCIPLGIPVPYHMVDKLRGERRRARKKVTHDLALDAARPILLYVGRLAKEKSIDVVLSAAKELGVPFIFAGVGPLEREVETNPDVIALGAVHGRALSELYLAADLFVSASITETVGRVFLESLAFGTPVVVPDKGHHNSLLPDDHPAIFKYPHTRSNDNVETLLRAVHRILEVGSWRDSSLAAPALDFALSYSWENVIPAFVDCYENVWDRRRIRMLNDG